MVSLLPIRVYGDPVLNEATAPVADVDASIRALADSMIETMYDAPGVGLSANQVGVQKRLFVYDEGEGDGPFVIVNPTIVETDGEWTFHEGCLSVPGLSWDITRPDRVHLTGFDLDGHVIDIETDQYRGRIFQHEVDHLNGILLVERLDADQRREAKILLRERRVQIGAHDADGVHRLFSE